MGRYEPPLERFPRRSYPWAERSCWHSHRRSARAREEEAIEPRYIPQAEEGEEIFHGLIASGGKLVPRNPMASFGALVFQASMVALLAIVPLFRVEPLPKKETQTTVYLEAPVTHATVAAIKAPAVKSVQVQAKTISAPVHPIPELQKAPIETTNEFIAGTGIGSGEGALTGVPGIAAAAAAPAKAAAPAPVKRIRVAAHVAEANLIHDVPPQYPPEAGRERIQGAVVLVAVIGTDGSVKDVRVESGPAQLTQAAIDAVKQWRYKPYLLNGVPVEIDSRITINFTMSRG